MTDVGIIECLTYNKISTIIINQYHESYILELLTKYVSDQKKYLVHKYSSADILHEAIILHMLRIFETTNWLSFDEFQKM